MHVPSTFASLPKGILYRFFMGFYPFIISVFAFSAHWLVVVTDYHLTSLSPISSSSSSSSGSMFMFVIGLLNLHFAPAAGGDFGAADPGVERVIGPFDF